MTSAEIKYFQVFVMEGIREYYFETVSFDE